MPAHFSVTCTVNQKQPIFQELKIHVHMTIDKLITHKQFNCQSTGVYHDIDSASTQLSKYQKLNSHSGRYLFLYNFNFVNF